MSNRNKKYNLVFDDDTFFMLKRIEFESKQQREADKVLGIRSDWQSYFYNKIKGDLADNIRIPSKSTMILKSNTIPKRIADLFENKGPLYDFKKRFERTEETEKFLFGCEEEAKQEVLSGESTNWVVGAHRKMCQKYSNFLEFYQPSSMPSLLATLHSKYETTATKLSKGGVNSVNWSEPMRIALISAAHEANNFNNNNNNNNNLKNQ